MKPIRVARCAAAASFSSGRQVVVDYGNRPLPRLEPRGWRKAWSYVDAALLFVRYATVTAALGFVLVNAVRVYRGVRIW